MFLYGKSRLLSVKGADLHKVSVKSFFKYSKERRQRQLSAHAHLEDFDFLAKKDLGLGQVLLINAFDGYLPIGLLQKH